MHFLGIYFLTHYFNIRNYDSAVIIQDTLNMIKTDMGMG